MLPLYRTSEAGRRVLACRPLAGNAGLWFDKFARPWRWDERRSTLEFDKTEWLRSFRESKAGVGSELLEFAWRQAELVQAMKGEWAVFRAESRFVTGLGRAHPVENGLAWHYTLGTPYLPGSSVKGLTLAWARLVGTERKDEIFGAPGASGMVAFLDAVPIEPVCLEVDVITPHYAGWSASDPPGDWRSPVPIHFLTVGRGSFWFFGVVPVPGRGEAQTAKVAFELLEAALAERGAGARTAVGFGLFARDRERTEKLSQHIAEIRRREQEEARRRELGKTREGAWLLELERKSEDEVHDLVRRYIEKEQLESAEERCAFAKAVLALPMAQSWRKGEKFDSCSRTGGTKAKERFRLLKKLADSQE